MFQRLLILCAFLTVWNVAAFGQNQSPSSDAPKIPSDLVSLRTFPTLLWAKTFFLGSKPMAEFAASEGAEKPPQVKF